jgi:hypothetical protein
MTLTGGVSAIRKGMLFPSTLSARSAQCRPFEVFLVTKAIAKLSDQPAGFGFANLMRLGATRRGPE